MRLWVGNFPCRMAKSSCYMMGFLKSNSLILHPVMENEISSSVGSAYSRVGVSENCEQTFMMKEWCVILECKKCKQNLNKKIFPRPTRFSTLLQCCHLVISLLRCLQTQNLETRKVTLETWMQNVKCAMQKQVKRDKRQQKRKNCHENNDITMKMNNQKFMT